MQKKKGTAKKIEIDRDRLVEFLDRELQIATVADYSCNGLQVEGTAKVKRVGLAVDACRATFSGAVEQGCDMLIVHHGIIWGGLQSIRGACYRQVRFLIEHGLNLYAAHLPLDLHSTFGNNAGLAALLNLKRTVPFGLHKGVTIGYEGSLPRATALDAIVETLCRGLDTECTVLPFGKKTVKRIAIVSGGGADELAQAIEKGVDLFVTGEPDHKNYHEALEAGINVVYAGHYHTEKPGVQAVGRALTKQFTLETVFVDVPTQI